MYRPAEWLPRTGHGGRSWSIHGHSIGKSLARVRAEGRKLAMAQKRGKRRVLAVASGGGHWIQLQRLRPAFSDSDVAFVSCFPDYAEGVSPHRYYAVADVTRRNLPGLLKLGPQLVSILLRERPDVVITTGALPGLVALALGKLFGARTVWIDSIANCERLSSSGAQARRVADVWLTQWPSLAETEGPEYWGAVL